ncbi:glycoside hydrolase family 43 protein [Lutibacter sp.]|uniref:glycoside hydrolase family 43 protein n=1 Tax=Lutibacter sp. TaxID=1925666 RepID=UPI001A35F14E|nr:glycoside hydrolase family 43 protein [Lutibacter sp.]MBI9041628.1 glycoside hydrolase family 43 protein [Lutibacter sp.]
MKKVKTNWHKLIVVFNLIFILSQVLVIGQEIPNTFKNPILSGYHPDPSFCRVGDDYYLVNSTFIWYPGIPIYHSKDLVNREQIGNGIHRPDQIDLDGLQDRMGIYAVKIRQHDDLFYLITTGVGSGGNFYLIEKDPVGPWPNPIWIKDAPGIDPSLMRDEDGNCYYPGHTWIEEQVWQIQCGIWTQELDLEQQKLVGQRKIFTYGHENNASYTEGPHLYKINGAYMLILSEGGAGLYHALSVHHSDSLWGPYITDMINPVLTHRHLGSDYPIQAIGHGDLVETQNGEWWCVSLGKRIIDGETTLARETFLSKVEFDGKTPVFNRGEGKVLEEQQRPNLTWNPFKEQAKKDEFETSELVLKWCTIRTPKEQFYEISNGNFEMNLRPEVIDSLVNSSLIIQRIEHHQFSASTKLSFKTSTINEQAGLAIYRTNENFYLLLKGKNELVLIKSFKGIKEEIARVPYTNSEIFLKAEADNLEVVFSYDKTENNMKQIGEIQSLIVIADGNRNQFNGAGIGMYATSHGQKTKATASFDWFEYKEK